MKRLVYRVQRHAAITGPECSVLLGLAGLLLLGLAVQHLQSPSHSIPEGAYDEAGRALREGAPDDGFPHHVGSFAGQALRPGRTDSTVNNDTSALRNVMFRIDLNAATAAELEGLPRIGPALAQRILAHRAMHGPFAHVRELTEVKGIGEKTFKRIEPFVYVGKRHKPAR